MDELHSTLEPGKGIGLDEVQDVHLKQGCRQRSLQRPGMEKRRLIFFIPSASGRCTALNPPDET